VQFFSILIFAIKFYDFLHKKLSKNSLLKFAIFWHFFSFFSDFHFFTAKQKSIAKINNFF